MPFDQPTQIYNNKTTRVWYLREQKHTRDGLWPRKPQRPQVEIDFRQRFLYLSYATKTMEKQLLILEFHTPSSPWRCNDITPTSRRPDQQYAWRHWDSAMTLDTTEKICIPHMLYLILLYHPRIPRLDRRIWYCYTTPGYHGSITVSDIVIPPPDTTARSPYLILSYHPRIPRLDRRIWYCYTTPGSIAVSDIVIPPPDTTAR
jgi:hypothetical protein